MGKQLYHIRIERHILASKFWLGLGKMARKVVNLSIRKANMHNDKGIDMVSEIV